MQYITNYIRKIPPLEILKKTVNSYPQSCIKLVKKQKEAARAPRLCPGGVTAQDHHVPQGGVAGPVQPCSVAAQLPVLTDLKKKKKGKCESHSVVSDSL